MPRTPSSPADRPKWLRFEAGDEESHELFAPGANWRKQDQYPALKPLDSYTRDDYLRLAWELLRRMPRYRRQHRKLDQLGIKSPSFFKSSPKLSTPATAPQLFQVGRHTRCLVTSANRPLQVRTRPSAPISRRRRKRGSHGS